MALRRHSFPDETKLMLTWTHRDFDSRDKNLHKRETDKSPEWRRKSGPEVLLLAKNLLAMDISW